MGMMYGGGYMGFGFLYALIYLGAMVYFFYLLTCIAKSLRRIANSLEKRRDQSSPTEEQ